MLHKFNENSYKELYALQNPIKFTGTIPNNKENVPLSGAYSVSDMA